MGTVTDVASPIEGGTRTPISRGAARYISLIGKHLMGATYATNGDTITMPGTPPGGTLFCVEVIAVDTLLAGREILWNGSLVTPKLQAFVETAGASAELANASATLAAVNVYLRFIYKVGG